MPTFRAADTLPGRTRPRGGYLLGSAWFPGAMPGLSPGGRVMAAYYNEIDSYAAQWLRNLIAAGHIADGVVDDRSIKEVTPDDVRGFTQCHFFAGIGVWSYALRCAGWDDDRPVWTGSCPCQPFSVAGRGKGEADDRHLWPELFRLASECRPGVVLGEQVAGSAGAAWLDLVFADMEGIDYACGAVVASAAGVGAPHYRPRIFWMADAAGGRREAADYVDFVCDPPPGERQAGFFGTASGSDPAKVNGFWRAAEWLACADEKRRPVEPGAFPLVDGFAGGVGSSRSARLKGYGNAIVAPLAAEFIGAVMECLP